MKIIANISTHSKPEQGSNFLNMSFYLSLAEAERLFCKALGHVQACTNEMLEERWEPLINNLGHVARRQHRYEEALDYHKQALVLVPQSASTYSAIGEFFIKISRSQYEFYNILF